VEDLGRRGEGRSKGGFGFSFGLKKNKAHSETFIVTLPKALSTYPIYIENFSLVFLGGGEGGGAEVSLQ